VCSLKNRFVLGHVNPHVLLSVSLFPLCSLRFLFLSSLQLPINLQGEWLLREHFAQVQGLTTTDPDWPTSPWDALEVRYENQPIDLGQGETRPLLDEVERVAPWEATPFYDASTALHKKQLALNNASVKLDASIVDRIARGLDALLEAEPQLAEYFQFPVNSEQLPDYYCLVCVPMYLDLIRRRLTNRYYRQVSEWRLNVWRCDVGIKL
jgi:hypothetical protein